MYLREAFDEFIATTIRLDETRRKRIQRAHNTVRSELESIPEVGSKMQGTFLQGSYPQHTATKPVNEDGSYDVDVIFAGDFSSERGRLLGPSKALGWLRDHIESIGRYSGKTKLKASCVCLDYARDMHLDIVPAHCPEGMEQPIMVPRAEFLDEEWFCSNPRGFMKWFKAKRKESEHLLDVVRLMKHWRNLRRDNPNSMVVTTLCTKHIPENASSVDEALTQTQQNILAWMKESSGTFGQGLRVSNPSLPDEDLARNWSWASRRRFYDQLQASARLAERAINSKDEAETIELWNRDELFKGQFPKKKRGLGEEAKALGERFSAGAVTIGANGALDGNNSARNKPVRPNNGFFGST